MSREKAGVVITKRSEERGYTLVLGYALPFFLGLAILWVFLKLDIDRQYTQTTQDIEFRLQVLADSSMRDLQDRISAIDSGLKTAQKNYFTDRSAIVELPAVIAANLKKMEVDVSPEMYLLDASGEVVYQVGFDRGNRKPVNFREISAGQQLTDFMQVWAVPTTASQYVAFARPVFRDGVGIGWVVFKAEASVLSLRSVKETVVNRDYLISVTDKAGFVLWRDADAGEKKLYPWVGLKEYSAHDSGASSPPRHDKDSELLEIAKNVSGVDNIERLYYSQNSSVYPLKILVGIRPEVAYQNHNFFRNRHVLSAVLVSVLLIVSLYWFFAFRNTVEEADKQQRRDMELLEKSEQQLFQSRQQLRELARHQMNLKEVERKRIALEIHDELGQRITALRLELGLLERKIKQDVDPLVLYSIGKFKNQIDGILNIVRNVATRLRPAILDLGIAQAVAEHVKTFRDTTSIQVGFHNHLPNDFRMSEEQTIGIFRILQESLTNIARHSGAHQVMIELSISGDFFQMRIEDDGVGFASSETMGLGSLGISGMRERAIALNGTCEVVQKPSGGILVSVSIPLEPNGHSSFSKFSDPLAPIRSE